MGLSNSRQSFFDNLSGILNASAPGQGSTDVLSGRDAYLFWINRVVGSAPRIMKTKTVLSRVAINKSSIRLIRRANTPSMYDVEFTFDATTDCVVSVAYCVEEVRKEGRLRYVSLQSGNCLEVPSSDEMSDGNGGSEKKELMYSSAGVDRATFSPNLNQSFSTAGMQGLDISFCVQSTLYHSLEGEKSQICREENASMQSSLKEEEINSLSGLMASSKVPEGESASTAVLEQATNTEHDGDPSDGKRIIPVVIVIEPVYSVKEPNSLNIFKKKIPRDTISSEIILLELSKNNPNYDCHIAQQKIFVNGFVYNVHDVYGIEQSLYTTEEKVLDSTYTGPDECVICLGEHRNTLVLPCRHLCLCEDCAETITYHSTKCPICRGPLRLLLRIEFNDENGTGKEYKSTPASRAMK
ncbi:uncharacterized protein LOC126316754 isoform X2 [Schistocerca gregaria]|uniref:uncharacterized protein LOC126316754 isoform X2 n=1 Tax=Schistocerca gregaria TaxID=7010 RepID=UPI00211E1443|nr:uncharacterized protein LOC126316754 isoform X2 [Schistocerca gregaria]